MCLLFITLLALFLSAEARPPSPSSVSARSPDLGDLFGWIPGVGDDDDDNKKKQKHKKPKPTTFTIFNSDHKEVASRKCPSMEKKCLSGKIAGGGITSLKQKDTADADCKYWNSSIRKLFYKTNLGNYYPADLVEPVDEGRSDYSTTANIYSNCSIIYKAMTLL